MHAIYKTQYSEILVEYENRFNMNTGNLIVDPMATTHSPTDGNPYVSVYFQKNIGRVGGKLKPQDTITRNITYKPHIFWRNLLWYTFRYKTRLPQ